MSTTSDFRVNAASAVEILNRAVKAWSNGLREGTYQPNSVAADLVGLFVAESMNCKVIMSGGPGQRKIQWVNRRTGDEIEPKWQDVFCTRFSHEHRRLVQERHENLYVGEAKEQLDSTGVHWKVLADIEFAPTQYRHDRHEIPLIHDSYMRDCWNAVKVLTKALRDASLRDPLADRALDSALGDALQSLCHSMDNTSR